MPQAALLMGKGQGGWEGLGISSNLHRLSPKSWDYKHEAMGVLRGLGKLTYNLTFELLLCLHTYSM